MSKILLAVDGSDSAVHAARKLVQLVASWKEMPEIQCVYVHLPVPHVGGFASTVVNREMIERYYTEEGAQALAPCVKVLDEAGVPCASHVLVGDVAQTLVHHARTRACALICMGSRGMSAISNLVLGSVATKVLHLADMPVLIVP